MVKTEKKSKSKKKIEVCPDCGKPFPPDSNICPYC